MKALLVANPKGGSGKTTLAINMAGYLASRGQRVAMLDLDRQKSASHWLASRAPHLPPIQLLDELVGQKNRIDWLIIDSPAGLHGKNQDYALKLVNYVVVPIAPSAFDIQASRDFLQQLCETKLIRKNKVSIGVVGMRMDPRTRVAITLEQFLKELDLPILAYLRDTQAYVNTGFEGKTLFDLSPSQAGREWEQWEFMCHWMEQLNSSI